MLGRRGIQLLRNKLALPHRSLTCGTGSNNLRRYFSDAKDGKTPEADEFRKIFEGQDEKYTFSSYEVYYLRKDLEMLKRFSKISLITGASLITGGVGVYFGLGWATTAFILGGLGIVPIVRGLFMRHKSANLVSSLWLSPRKDQIELFYGTSLNSVLCEIKDFFPKKTIPLKTSKAQGFSVIFDVKDDMGKIHPNLVLYVEPTVCTVENVNLLSAIIAADYEQIQKYQYIGEPVNPSTSDSEDEAK